MEEVVLPDVMLKNSINDSRKDRILGDLTMQNTLQKLPLQIPRPLNSILTIIISAFFSWKAVGRKADFVDT